MLVKDEAARCLLCHEAKCTMACLKGQDPARALRAVRFDNEAIAGRFLDSAQCAECDAPCEKACIHYDRSIRIKELAQGLPACSNVQKPSLAIDFCGVHCENPFFLSSSCIAANYEMVSNAFKMGWGGVVFKTVGMDACNEVSPRFSAVRKDGTPFVGFKNLEQISDHTPEENFEAIRRLKQDFPSKVIIASIMGNNDEEWVQLTRMACEAGADIIAISDEAAKALLKKFLKI